MDNDWIFSKATPEQVQELFKSMIISIKPPIMAPSLEDRVKELEEQVASLLKVIES